MTVWVLVLAAIALQAAGQVVQKQRVAKRAPNVSLADVVRRPGRFFGALLRDPAWVASHGCNFAGALLGLQAVAMLDLTVFKSLWQLQSLLVVLAGALLLREHLLGIEVLGIGVMLAGAGLLASAGIETSGGVATTGMNLAFVGTAVASLSLLGLASRRWPARVTPEIALALAAGVLFGCGDVLTKGATGLVKARLGSFSLVEPQTALALVAQPEFALAILAVGSGLVLLQTAFSTGRVSVVGPLTGVGGLALPMVVGFAFLGERVDASRAGAVAAMAAGTVLLGLRDWDAPTPGKPA